MMAAKTISSLHRRRQDPPLNRNLTLRENENAFLDSRPSKKKQLRVHFIHKMARWSSSLRRSSLASQSTLILAVMTVIWGILQAHALHQRSHPGAEQIQNMARHVPVSFSWEYRDDVRPFYSFHVVSSKKRELEPPEYNGLDIKSLSDSRIFSRRIDPEDHKAYETYRERRLRKFDKTYVASPYEPDEDLQADENRPCKRTSWRSTPHPNCNNVHELPLGRPPNPMQNFDVRYLG
jgi:hypothetical protein